MTINQTEKFDTSKGNYCILNDYGSEGLSVYGMYNTLEEAIKGLGYSTCKQTIVKVVEFDIKEKE